jgi:glycosyltransferase involved in cell wall biosynthesis
MAFGHAAPWLIRREVPRDLDVLHLPVTVPIPALDLPTVVTVHDVLSHTLPGALPRAERRYRRWAYDGSARAATRVVAMSRYVADRLCEVVGVDRSRIDVIPMGIDHQVFRPQPGPHDQRLLAPLGLPERFLFYPANLWPHKNHARLLEAFGRVSDKALGLVLAGQGYGRLGEVDQHARRAGVADRVLHIRQVGPPTVAALYRRARALVYPSLNEGFGAPPLEAMACGCPVLSTLNTALGDVCDGAALELDPNDSAAMSDAIDRIEDDQALRTSLCERGVGRAAQFTWAAAADRHRATYAAAAA